MNSVRLETCKVAYLLWSTTKWRKCNNNTTSKSPSRIHPPSFPHSATVSFQAIEGGEVTKHIFDLAQMRVLSIMENELSNYLRSSTHKELNKRIKNGEMDELAQEDIENVKDLMSKEVGE